MNPTDPTDRARAAFDDLDTPEKTAFVIEATFSTIGAALRETGQRLADVITEFDPDSFFRDATAPGARARGRAGRAEAGQEGRAQDLDGEEGSREEGGSQEAGLRTATPGAKTAGRPGKEDDEA